MGTCFLDGNFQTCGFWRTRPALILAVVAAIEVFLCIDYHQERWHKALAPLGQTRSGEGLVIRSDGLGYYAWLRSLLIDGDWAFDNEFDGHNPLRDYVPPSARRTAAGKRPNQWSVGPACVWALVVVPGHFICQASTGADSFWPADGYSLPYQFMVGGTTLLAALAGLGLLYRIGRRHADPEAAAWAAAFLTLGTTIVYYSAIEVSMAHGLGTVAVAWLVWYWQKTYGSDHWRRWLAVGALVGVAALMRWQLVTFALLPAGEWALLVWRRRQDVKTQLILGMSATLGAWLAFLPQMIAWRIVYGQWLARPLATAHHWDCPALCQLLFAQDRGLFYWTPLTLAAFGGTAWFLVQAWWTKRETESATEMTALLVGAFALQVYILASLWGAEVSLAVAFGFRQLTEALVALTPGLALLLGRWRRGACVAGCLLVLWNLLLIGQYRYGWIPADAGADPLTLLANVGRFVSRKKFLIVEQALLGPLLLLFLLGWRSKPTTRVPSGRLGTRDASIKASHLGTTNDAPWTRPGR